MVFKDFDSVMTVLRPKAVGGRIAVAGAADEHTLQAVFKAQDQGIVTPVFVGCAKEIKTVCRQLGHSLPSKSDIIDCAEPAEIARQAVALVRSGRADSLIKGSLTSSQYLQAVVDRDAGLGTGNLMTHFVMLEIPGYHKVIFPADTGMVPYPTLEQKAAIIRSTVALLHKLGYQLPKVAVLACTENMTPKMPETVDAAALKQMNLQGELPGCIIEGPISYDCAMCAPIAEAKKYSSPVAGDSDILLVPNIHAGNILGKALTIHCKSRMAGFILGAAAPVIMTSRASSEDEKYLSIILAAAVARL